MSLAGCLHEHGPRLFAAALSACLARLIFGVAVGFLQRLEGGRFVGLLIEQRISSHPLSFRSSSLFLSNAHRVGALALGGFRLALFARFAERNALGLALGKCRIV